MPYPQTTGTRQTRSITQFGQPPAPGGASPAITYGNTAATRRKTASLAQPPASPHYGLGDMSAAGNRQWLGGGLPAPEASGGASPIKPQYGTAAHPELSPKIQGAAVPQPQQQPNGQAWSPYAGPARGFYQFPAMAYGQNYGSYPMQGYGQPMGGYGQNDFGNSPWYRQIINDAMASAQSMPLDDLRNAYANTQAMWYGTSNNLFPTSQGQGNQFTGYQPSYGFGGSYPGYPSAGGYGGLSALLSAMSYANPQQNYGWGGGYNGNAGNLSQLFSTQRGYGDIYSQIYGQQGAAPQAAFDPLRMK